MAHPIPPLPPPVAATEQLNAKINQVLQALRARGAVVSNCPRCNQNNWRADLLAYFVSPLPVTSMPLPPPHVPTLTLTCTICGNTLIHNLNALGIAL